MNITANLSGVMPEKALNNMFISSKGLKGNNGAFLKILSQLNNGKAGSNILNQVETAESSELSTVDMVSLCRLIDFVPLQDEGYEFNSENTEDEPEIKEDKTSAKLLNFISMMNYGIQADENAKLVKLFPENIGNLEPKTIVSTNATNYESLDHYVNKEIPLSPKIMNSLDNEQILTEIQHEKSNNETLVLNEHQKNETDFNSEMISPDRIFVPQDTKIIQVSDESSMINSQVLNQVKDKIIFMKEDCDGKENIKYVTMELKPKQLGKVDIKMTIEDGKMTVEIKALNKDTQNILHSKVSELAEVLKGTTNSSVNIIVKGHELPNGHQVMQNENNEHRYNENYDQENGHGRHRNFYSKQEDENNTDEEDVFAKLMNLRSEML